ncbi:ATP-binding protein [Streptomyces sp. TP-A0874]|uniref:ATP-binding protein n=1 Tax=Streptomyces sp. TP-A0874 TaxID=549819 RepID=UPI0035B54D56
MAGFRGRDFSLRLVCDTERGVLRVEVSDPHPGRPRVAGRDADAECGRGLVLVDALADRWDVRRRVGPGKTVWAEFDYRRGGAVVGESGQAP